MKLKALFLILIAGICQAQAQTATNIAVVKDRATSECSQLIKFTNTNNTYAGMSGGGITNAVTSVGVGAGLVNSGSVTNPVIEFSPGTTSSLSKADSALQSELDPKWSAESNLYLKSFTETDPLWSVRSNDVITAIASTNTTTKEMTNIVSFPVGIKLAGMHIYGTTTRVSIANISFDGHFVPTTSNAYDIGSISRPVRDMYLSTNTLKFIGETGTYAMSVSTNGQIQTASGTNAPQQYLVSESDTLQSVINRGHTSTGSVYLASALNGDAVLAIGTNSGTVAKLYVKGVSGSLTNVPLVLIEGSANRSDDFIRITGNGGSTTNFRVDKTGVMYGNGSGLTDIVPATRTVTINGISGVLTSNITFTAGNAYLANYNVFTSSNRFSESIVIGANISHPSAGGSIEPYGSGMKMQDSGGNIVAYFTPTTRYLYGTGGIMTVDFHSRILTDYDEIIPWSVTGMATSGLQIVNHNAMTNYLTKWDDLTCEANNLRIVGSADVTMDGAENAVVFDTSCTTNQTDDHVYFTVQFPHSWKTNTTIYPHVHFIQTNADQTNMFVMKYRWYNVGDTMPTWTAISQYTNAHTYVSGMHQVGIFPEISGSGKIISSLLDVKIYRDGTKGTGNIALKQWDTHIMKDGTGSDEMMRKNY